MRFHHPVIRIEFEIPDAWLLEANAGLFVRSAPAFAATSDPDWPTELVALANVAVPQRDPGVAGLNRERTVSLLKAIVARSALPPLEAHRPPNATQLAVRDGFHRYFVSVALGFPMLPLSVRPYFDITRYF